MHDMYWKADRHQRPQRVGANDVAAVDDSSGAFVLRGPGGGEQRIGTVMAVGNDADLHRARRFVRTRASCSSYDWTTGRSAANHPCG